MTSMLNVTKHQDISFYHIWKMYYFPSEIKSFEDNEVTFNVSAHNVNKCYDVRVTSVVAAWLISQLAATEMKLVDSWITFNRVRNPNVTHFRALKECQRLQWPWYEHVTISPVVDRAMFRINSWRSIILHHNQRLDTLNHHFVTIASTNKISNKGPQTLTHVRNKTGQWNAADLFTCDTVQC
jgi:hypothetical protein